MTTTTVTNQQTRERILARLWQIADLSPEATKNNINGQLKALTMIVAIEGLIPNKFNTQLKPAASPATGPGIEVSLENPARLVTPATKTSDLAMSAFMKTANLPAKAPWNPAASLAENLAAISGR